MKCPRCDINLIYEEDEYFYIYICPKCLWQKSGFTIKNIKNSYKYDLLKEMIKN